MQKPMDKIKEIAKLVQQEQTIVEDSDIQIPVQDNGKGMIVRFKHVSTEAPKAGKLTLMCYGIL